MKILIENKADYKILNDSNKTACEEAYDRGFFDISEYLIENESDHSCQSSLTDIKEDPETIEMEAELKETEKKLEK